MAVIVPILSTFNDKGIKAAVREFQTAKTSIQKFGAVGKIFEGVGNSLTKNLTVPLVAVGAAFGVMIKGAIDAGAAQHRLRQLLITTGGATDAQVDALLRQAEALEKVGVASKESIVTTQAQLATFDLQGSTIEKLTPAILDYVLAEKGATATAEDFKSMTNGLAQALNGQFGSLTRTGFVLDDVTKELISNGTESERAAAIVDVLNSTYKDFNKSLLDTPEGQFIKLQQEFGALRDEVGIALLPTFNDLMKIMRNDIVPIFQSGVKVIKDIAKNFSALEPETRKNIITFVGVIAVLGPMLIFIGKIIGAIKVFIGVFKALTIVMMANPIGFIVTAIALLVTAFITAYKTSEKFRNVVNGAINAVITVVENLANGFIEAYNTAILPVFNKILTGLKRINPDIELMGEIGEVTFKRLGISTRAYSQDISTMSDFAKEMAGISTKELAPALDRVGSGLKDTGDKASKTKDRIKELRDALVKMREEAVDKLQQSLKNAESQLDSARGKFNEFKNAIAGNITGLLDFAKASEGDNFVQGLVGQVADATDFANKVKQLIQLGLSERGITEVLDAGFEAGTRIADELIAGGSTVVQQVNTLLASVSSVADQVGDFGARQFYQAGVTQGEALVNGILDSLRAAQAELAAAQRAALSGGGIGDFKNLGARATGLLGQIQGLSGKAQSNALADFSRALEQSKGAPAISTKELASIQKKYKLAKGGIVMGPTNALIGEAGPEAVVPLSGANSAGLGNTINITINAGMGTDGAAVGRQVVDAIRKYERISGPVFAKA
jgi:hypothetical protein